MDAPTDQKVLKDFLEGKAGSFEFLVRRHTSNLYQFVLRFTGDAVTAEDVVQETFLQVYSSAGTFDPSRRFKPWLFTIAANKARDALRRRNRRHEVPFDASIGSENDSGRRFLDLISNEDAAADEELLADEKRRMVREVIESMPDHLGEVLILAYYHRFPYKEIAEIVGIPLGTVKSRLHAAVVCFGERYRELAEKAQERENR